MKTSRFIFKLLVCAFLGNWVLVALGQQVTNNELSARRKSQFRPGCNPTPAYQKEMVRIMIEEANRFAQQMNLSSDTPITETNITGTYIWPPCHCLSLGEIGGIDALNYSYSVDIAKGITSVDRLSILKEWDGIKAKYTLPFSRLDTNNAFQEALQILKVADVDVDALNRDASSIMIKARTDSSGKDFIPVYSVTWKKPTGDHFVSLRTGGQIAFVEFLEPTKTIHHLHIFNSRYILRLALRKPDLAALLATDPTNNPPESVIREIEAATNPAVRREIFLENHVPESDLKRWGFGTTDSEAGTNTRTH